MNNLKKVCDKHLGDTYTLSVEYESDAESWKGSISSPILTKFVTDNNLNYGQKFEKLVEYGDEYEEVLKRLTQNMTTMYKIAKK